VPTQLSLSCLDGLTLHRIGPAGSQRTCATGAPRPDKIRAQEAHVLPGGYWETSLQRFQRTMRTGLRAAWAQRGQSGALRLSTLRRVTIIVAASSTHRDVGHTKGRRTRRATGRPHRKSIPGETLERIAFQAHLLGMNGQAMRTPTVASTVALAGAGDEAAEQTAVFRRVPVVVKGLKFCHSPESCCTPIRTGSRGRRAS
jgi:hypothetical protein